MNDTVRCRITEVISETNKAILVTFQNGDLIPEEAQNLECGLYQNKKTGQHVVAVATKDLVYTGSEMPSENSISKTLIAVRNKKTNKVRLISTKCFTLLPTFPQQPEETTIVTETETAEENRYQLGIKFGSKRQQRMVEDKAKLKINESIIEKQITKATQDVEISEADIKITENTVSQEYMPPLNRNATEPEDVFNIHDILRPSELQSLEEEAVRLMEEPEEIEIFSDFFKKYFTLSNKSQKQYEEIIKDVCILLYIETLINFHKTNASLFRKNQIEMCPFSQVIDLKIYDQFTTASPVGRTRSNLLKDKVVFHIIILSLFISNFQLDISLVAKNLKFSTNRMLQYCGQIGALPVASKSNIVTIKIPVKISERKPTNRKRNA